MIDAQAKSKSYMDKKMSARIGLILFWRILDGYDFRDLAKFQNFS